jgi:hypothetical protein
MYENHFQMPLIEQDSNYTPSNPPLLPKLPLQSDYASMCFALLSPCWSFKSRNHNDDNNYDAQQVLIFLLNITKITA